MGPCVGDDGEADGVIVEADPGDFLERVEGGDEFCLVVLEDCVLDWGKD